MSFKEDIYSPETRARARTSRVFMIGFWFCWRTDRSVKLLCTAGFKRLLQMFKVWKVKPEGSAFSSCSILESLLGADLCLTHRDSRLFIATSQGKVLLYLPRWTIPVPADAPRRCFGRFVFTTELQTETERWHAWTTEEKRLMLWHHTLTITHNATGPPAQTGPWVHLCRLWATSESVWPTPGPQIWSTCWSLLWVDIVWP